MSWKGSLLRAPSFKHHCFVLDHQAELHQFNICGARFSLLINLRQLSESISNIISQISYFDVLPFKHDDSRCICRPTFHSGIHHHASTTRFRAITISGLYIVHNNMADGHHEPAVSIPYWDDVRPQARPSATPRRESISSHSVSVQLYRLLGQHRWINKNIYHETNNNYE